MSKISTVRHFSLLFVASLWAPLGVAQNDTEAALGRRKLSTTYKAPVGEKSVPVAFFDADSTLRVSISGSVSANSSKDVFLLPCVADRLAAVNKAGYLIAVVSNQGGIPRHVSLQDADGGLQHTVKLIRDAGGEVHWYDFAEHDDENRKPKIGMAGNLAKSLKAVGRTIDLSRSFMVGDSAFKKGVDPGGTHFSNSDRLFAEALFNNFADDKPPYRFEEAAVFFGWRNNGVDVFQGEGKERTGVQVVTEYLLKHAGESACPKPDSQLF